MRPSGDCFRPPGRARAGTSQRAGWQTLMIGGAWQQGSSGERPVFVTPMGATGRDAPATSSISEAGSWKRSLETDAGC